MNARRLTIALFVALGISGVFTLMLSRHVTRRPAAVPRRQYVAASHDLASGEVLRADSIRLVEWPVSSPIEGGFDKPAAVVGRAVLYPLASGQPILEKQLASAGSGMGLSIKIPDGMRAVSLRTDEVVGVAGFLLPGTHVDMLVTYREAGVSEPVTMTVLQNVEVLTAGQKMTPDPDGKATTVNVVTLLLKPEEAEKAVLASSQGAIHFVLRNGGDRTPVADTRVNLSELNGGKEVLSGQAAASFRRSKPVSANRGYVVETYLGTKQTLNSFN
jgi:pilus assembly protein CpaB